MLPHGSAPAWALFVQSLHSQATTEESTVQSGTLRGGINTRFLVPAMFLYCSSLWHCCLQLFLLFCSKDNHGQSQSPWQLLWQVPSRTFNALEQDLLSFSKGMGCCEHFGFLQPCQTGYIRAHFVQNTLESNTDTSPKLPSFPPTLCKQRRYSRGTAKRKKF